MLTAHDFRRLALGMQEVAEGAHMGHPDFRVRGRIFATLHADLLWGMVKLSPDQQQEFMARQAGGFVPESGAWGRQGCTAVRLDATDEETLGEALTLAWQHGAREDQAKGRTRKGPRPAG
ncbi:MAG: MmcQ/YjbR family DNA-binding protein [Vicinamibacterales bacterium]